MRVCNYIYHQLSGSEHSSKLSHPVAIVISPAEPTMRWVKEKVSERVLRKTAPCL